MNDNLIARAVVVGAMAVGACVAYAGGDSYLSRNFNFLPYSEKIGEGKPSYLPQGCQPFEVERPRSVQGPVVKAADFGLDESRTDNGAAITKAMAEARRIGAKRIELKPGRYRIHHAGIVMEDMKDFTFDGMGAELVFYRPSRERPDMEQFQLESVGGNFLVKNCHRCVVKNFKMDWDWEVDPLADFARVVAKHIDEADNASYVDFKLTDLERHPKYPKPVPVIIIGQMREDRTNIAGHGWQCWVGHAEGHFGAKNEWISPNTLRVWPAVKMEGRNQVKAYAKLFSADNNRKQTKGLKDGALYRIIHYYYGQNAFNMDGNTHLTIEDVDIWACRGMGFQVRGAQHHWQVLHSSVSLPKALAGKRAITATADANHIVQSQGWCKFENCRWSMHIDDMNNFHDRLTIAVKHGEQGFRIVNCRGNAFFNAQVGDRIGLLNADYSPIDWKGVVMAVEGNDKLIMDRPTPKEVQECMQLYKCEFATDNIIFRNCDFTDGFGRNLLQSHNMTIEKCTFRHTSGLPIGLLAEWSYNAWCEGCGVSNVVVRDCTFDSNYVWNGGYRGLRSEIFSGARARAPIDMWKDNPNVPKNAAEITPCRKAASGILVERNRFLNAVGLIWHALPADDLIFRDNEIIYDGNGDSMLKLEPYCGSCCFEGARGVFVSGNKFRSSGSAAGLTFERGIWYKHQ